MAGRSKLRLIAGAVMLLLGVVALCISWRVLSTFLLEVVTMTIRSDSSPPLEPYDFSWGTMFWGRMSSDFSMLCAGLFLIVIGQFLVIPTTVGYTKSVTPTPKGPMVGLIGAAALTLIATLAFLTVAMATRSAFGELAATGSADPTHLGEIIPVRANFIFVVSLVAAQVFLLVAAFMAPSPGPNPPGTGRTILSYAACFSLLVFAVSITITRLGPVRFMESLISGSGVADPAAIAEKISLALNSMLLASLLLGSWSVLVLIAALIPAQLKN